MTLRQAICGFVLFGLSLLAGHEVFAQNAPAPAAPAASIAAKPAASAPGPTASAAPAPAASAPGAVPAAPAAPDSDKADTPDNADPSKDPLMNVSISQSAQNISKLREPDVKPQELASVFFTLWQYQLLQDAKRLYVTHPVRKEDIAKAGDQNQNRPRSIRELSVGGILYRGPEDWTVYLNGQRLTQDKNWLPEQVMDIKVTEDHVDLKWFDTFTNLIFPVRLRE
ncbi:MAG TPA: hypothetical protein VL625_11425, partial [Patescibacteria group bacterium]|nr:hypothetical protein [Patescibacteria group bacterium]